MGLYLAESDRSAWSMVITSVTGVDFVVCSRFDRM
jgi:hypothetical protein